MPPITRALSYRLDALRALAAFLVVAGHVTAAVFPQSPKDGATALFVAATGLGHHAVVIFFVLSGFLVGRKAIEAFVLGRSSGLPYAIDRITRIYVVLLPALIVGAALDSSLLYFLGGAADDCCRYVAGRLTVANFIGNLLGLQTVAVEVFGSNGPLWSMANEIWYYLLFPLALVAWFGESRWARITAAVIGMACISQLPLGLLKYGLLWLVGAAACAPTTNRLAPPFVGWLLLAACLATASSRYLSIPGIGFAHVAVTAVVVGLLINSYAHSPHIPNWSLSAIAKRLSDSSYSLYLFHFPFLMFLTHGPLRTSPTGVLDAHSLAIWLALLVTLYSYSYAMYWLTERHYHAVRKTTYRVFGLATLSDATTGDAARS